MIAHCRDRGYEPTLHPEAGTFIEAAWEIDRALEVSEFGLCLESGHQLVGGGDPLATLDRWGDRINHVHIKDARRRGDGWELVLLGEGEVPVAEALAAIRAGGYDGWYAVEWEKKWHPEIEEPEVAFPHFARTIREYLAEAGVKTA